MRKLILTTAITSLMLSAVQAADYSVESPDGKLKATIKTDGPLTCIIERDGKVLIPRVNIGLDVAGMVLPGNDAKLIDQSTRSEDTTITPPVAFKNSVIPDKYNELTLKFKDSAVVIRAYDDAVAYRLETALPGQIKVNTETCDITLPPKTTAYYSTTPRWMNEYSDLYEHTTIGEVTTNTVYLPMLFDMGKNGKVLLTESDIKDYPGLYFTGSEKDSNTLVSLLPPVVETEKVVKKPKKGWDRIFKPEKSFDYIADTTGTRSFPWRIFAVATKDTELLNNEIVYKLGEPSQIKDPSWIKPGLVAWDWWNANNLSGVDFRAGINNDTYKYFIDFASKNHIPYIVLDEGWYELGDATKLAKDINVKELVEYGRSKNVDVILWVVWRTLDEKLEEALQLYADWGVKGIKVDFMNRDDQAIVNFYFRCAAAAARHHMIVDYHGCHKPDGIQRTWPNVITFEAVAGLEQSKWSDTKGSPQMAVELPFIRMFTGPMDYTPGAMRNAKLKDFRPIFDYPMSQGTRCQQVAMYVLYESPLQMMSDLPTAYEKEQDSVDFITSIPTTWDKTIPLDAKLGEYLAVARQKGDNYYVGAITNWTKRDLTLDFDFLPEGTEFDAVIFQDGINADHNAIDYKRVTSTIKKGDKVKIHLAPGGGWAATLKPRK